MEGLELVSYREPHSKARAATHLHVGPKIAEVKLKVAPRICFAILGVWCVSRLAFLALLPFQKFRAAAVFEHLAVLARCHFALRAEWVIPWRAVAGRASGLSLPSMHYVWRAAARGTPECVLIVVEDVKANRRR